MVTYNNTQQPVSSGGSNTAITILAILVIAVLVVGAVWLMQDHRSASTRIGDAVATAPQGLGKAVNKLGDQPPAQNVARNVKDATK